MTISVRAINVKPTDATPRYWFAGSAFESHFFNALSSTFPEGERFFIQSVRRYAPEISDPALNSEIAAFAGQEGQHSLQHDEHVEILVRQGYKKLVRLNDIQRKVMRVFLNRVPRFSLALTVGVEHLTAILAHQMLSDPRWLDAMDEDMRLLWRWHAVEEIEHKAVAFDVYQATRPPSSTGFALRGAAMVEATLATMAEVFFRHLYLLWKDKRLFNRSEWSRGIRFLWGREGLLRSVAADYRRYWQRDFHPWEQDNESLIKPFLNDESAYAVLGGER